MIGVQWQTRGDKTLEEVDTPSNKGKEEGRRWETRRDKTLGKADTPSNKEKQEGRQRETRRDKTLGKADTPSNKGKQEGRPWETKGRQDPREGGHTIQQRETRRETMGARPSGRRTHHPTKGKKKGDNGRQGTATATATTYYYYY